MCAFVQRGVKRPLEKEEESEEEDNDEVKLGQDGWKDRYYSSKFHVPASDVKFRKTLVNSTMQDKLKTCALFQFPTRIVKHDIDLQVELI